MTKSAERIKPAKPYPDFPLTPHNSGKWAKKIRGKLHYFGRWEDPDGALRQYNAVKDDLAAGRAPVLADPSTVTIRLLFERFLSRQLRRVDNNRLEARHYADQKGALAEFARKVGPDRIVSSLRPEDFGAARDSFATHLGPHAINRSITNVKTAFNWGEKAGEIKQRPFYGDRFDKESVKVQRRAVREKGYITGKKLFSPVECRAILKAAPDPLKAMILLGLNAGFYGIDVATLPMAALDLDNAWLEYPRPKTEVMRMAPLWPETVKAIYDAIKVRPKPANPVDVGLLFLTRRGNRFIHTVVTRDDEGISRASRSNALNQTFAGLLDDLEIRRKGVNFSALRHTFRTAADEAGDKNAAMMIMGHAFEGMDEFYVRDVARKRLEKVTEHVRQKLLKPKKVRGRSGLKSGKRRRGR
jgi:integrase